MFSSRRVRYFIGHLAISACVVALFVVFAVAVWYPPPLHALQGIGSILLLLVLVDVCIGPLASLVVASPAKPLPQLRRDVSFVVAVQLLALAYGGWTIFIARPAFVAFNADRFDTVTERELVRNEQFTYRDPSFASSPVLGPAWVITRPPDSLELRNKLLLDTVTKGGPDTKAFPALYEPWPPARALVANHRLKPLAELRALSPEGAETVREAISKSGLRETDLSYVPLVGRERIGVVILNSNSLEIVHTSALKPMY
jgi:hypothetical protein